jgi:hypothetical protein
MAFYFGQKVKRTLFYFEKGTVSTFKSILQIALLQFLNSVTIYCYLLL